MKHIKFAILSVLMSISSLSFAQNNSFYGLVVGVSDGDTVKILDQNKQEIRVRLLGIDAPESKQDFGQVSKKTLSDMIYKQNVEVKFNKKDQYGRVIGKIVFNNQDINLIMVQKGMAWHYAQFAREQPPEDRNLYAQTQQQAQSQRIGLWNHPNPVAPWDFRRKK